MYGSIEGLEIYGAIDDTPKYGSSTITPHDILTTDALKFITLLHRTFNNTRKELLQNRLKIQSKIDNGESLHFLPETAYIRDDKTWRCKSPANGLIDRRSEITGPPDRKMIVNALNTDVRTYMTDFEDSCAPTWDNMIYAQVNLYDVLRDQIDFTIESTGKRYKVNREGRHVPTIIVRPRGWHMVEKHVLVDGEPMSASIFDFGLYFYHNAKYLIESGLGPYFYLPKMEHHLELKLWNDIFNVLQDCLSIQRGSISATVLIETLPLLYQMDEILYQLRQHSSGLNCGRWDYIFNTIKRLRNDPQHILPDRVQVTMKSPFMSAYVTRLIKICHLRGVHAMGGMLAQIPIKTDLELNSVAMLNVELDKLREVLAGHDGTWVAHPLLAPIANKVFNQYMPTPNQLHKPLSDVDITEKQLSDTSIEGGKITTNGIKMNLYIGLNYMESWVRGFGCVPINHLMEDAATAEVSRLQLWSWTKHGVKLDDTGDIVTLSLISQMIDEQIDELSPTKSGNQYRLVGELLKKEISGENELSEFLTTPLYDHILTLTEKPYDLSKLK